MGVMACDRKNCENIMCDTLIDEQYICNKCKAEFKDSVLNDQNNRIQQARIRPERWNLV
jgi:hypothetical protein